jgi:hypothetical protein
MKPLAAANGVFRWAAGAVVPMFVRPVAPVAFAWFVHVVLVAAIVVLLYFIQPQSGITVNVGRGPGWFRPYWLPAIFLLAYFLIWSAVWLWHALAPNQPTTDFPDLDAAWAEVLAALEKAGIGISDTPLFLVLGTPPGGYDPLFRSLPHDLIVAGGTNPTSPLRVYANRDGIYLAVPGASLLGVQDTSPRANDLEHIERMNVSIDMNASIGIDQSIGTSISGSFSSIGGSEPLQEIQRIIRSAREASRQLTEDEKQRIRVLSGDPAGVPAVASPSQRAAGSVLQDPRVTNLAADRLTHVCGLVAAARWPLCPLNGAILAVPMSVADKDESAQQWGLVARHDLTVAEAGFKLRFPVYALIGGAEDLPGGHLFFERFASDKGDRRLGKGFPLNPELRPTDAAAAVEAAVGWVFGNLLPYWSLRLMHVDNVEGSADSIANAQLVRFLAEVGRRGPHLARLLSRAAAAGDRVPLFGGCYLTVLPQTGSGGALFAKEFFRKVESTQGYIAWTDEAFDTDDSYRSATKLGYTALTVLLTAMLLFGGYVAYAKWMR